ncbi:heat-inducible transcription repressor HrcA [Williamsoniiplasma somnilux]|uniref:Heat-inducible transcription repressor HrcA n=1 Tax=Williamsoniiplasma somnilux TaxID=215578 RepID=A0A2K8NYB7_9MOLU|nr:heat-inducible transcriptional repressor HrcA [Williamsoniiplasma somnilux]ATZ18809.1 heat-inducible transcription repressor HrcA [Williamsoniiplasma somnilux]
MLTERQEHILKAIVQEFIKTVQPVGSKRILELLNVDISSATIRNESAALEEKGFLEKQHTSSGRVPSTQGYRYYVDFLMNKTDNTDLKKQLEKLKSLRSENIDVVLNQASSIISEMTKLTAIISTKGANDSVVLKKIDLIPLSNKNASVIFALSNGSIQTKVFNLNNTSLNDLSISIKLFSDSLIDTEISNIANKMNLIKPELEANVKNYEYILQTFLQTILQSNDVKREMYGMKYMLENPEFNDTEKIKSVINLMEHMSPFDWYDVRYSQNQQINKISTKIGEEISVDAGDIGIVGTEFEKNGSTTSITLVGPKRMDYNQANQLVQWLLELVNERGET